VPVPVALVVIVGGATVSLPWNVPLNGTWFCAACETAIGDAVEDAPIDAGTDVGLVGDVVRLHPANKTAAPMSTTMVGHALRTPFLSTR